VADNSLTGFEIAAVAAQSRAGIILLREYCTYPPDIEASFDRVQHELSALIAEHVPAGGGARG
jgi:hypothetical protein